MSEHLLINPDQLYFLYSVKDIKEDYYDFSIFPDYNSIEVEIFYNILNCLSMYELQNLLIFIYKQWSLFKLDNTLEEFSNNKRKKTILKQELLPTKIQNKEDFNHILKLFINEDPIMGIYIMNQLLKFLYPCKV
jgi:hypothetical protein